MKRRELLVSILLTVMLLSACAAPEAEVIEKEATKVVEVEEVVTATPEPEAAPPEGAKLVMASVGEPDTLDIQRSRLSASQGILNLIGATLVTRDPWTNEIIPYLAESWSVSEDGLTLEFILRDDVKFHDGTPLTAHEYAWTMQRAMDPEFLSPVTGGILSPVAGVEAVDDYTLRFTLWAPSYPLIDGLTTPFFVPMHPEYTQEMGYNYGRHPIGVGPYIFKEWVARDRIVLERNPDFTWGPAYTQGHPPYIETIEIRLIQEELTVFAGLETGEIDIAWLSYQDAERIPEMGEYQLVESTPQGTGEMIFLNNSKPPLDDVRVRQALNLAVDRDALVEIILHGYGAPSDGPVTPALYGYWSGVEDIGYSFDLEKAKALLADAGWAGQDGDGILEKDGEPLALTLLVFPTPSSILSGELLQEMYQRLGVEIKVVEVGQSSQVFSGRYGMAIASMTAHNTDLLFGMFHTSMLEAVNYSKVSDPILDPILERIHHSKDAETFLAASAEAQRYIIEQANGVFLYRSLSQAALSNEVQGAIISPISGRIELYDAYMEAAVP